MPLTPRQKALLDFITAFESKKGYAPSNQEIAQHFGFSSLGTVQGYLVRLQKEGHLTKTWNGKRSISVVDPKRARAVAAAKKAQLAPAPGNIDYLVASVSLPLLGRVAAGRPIEAIEVQDQIEVPASLVRHGDHFVLEVMGNSMIEDGILNGDYVIVKRQRTAETGQMVVALVDDAATVKRYHPKKGTIELHPANPAYVPIIVHPEQSFQIEGIVSGVIRKVL